MPTKSQNPGNHRPARRLSLRPDDHGGRRADLSDDVLSVQFDRARRQPVRAQGTRQHLHPDHESDAGRARRARRRARRRRRGARSRLGPGGLAVCGAEHLPRRRQFRLLDRHLWRHLEPVPEHDEHDGHRMPLRRSGRPREFPPRHRRARRAAITARRCPIRSSRCSRSPRSPRSGASSACR